MVKVRDGAGKVKSVWVQEDYELILKKMKDLRHELLSDFYYALAFPEPRKEMIFRVLQSMEGSEASLKEVKESLLTQEQLLEELPHLELVEAN